MDSDASEQAETDRQLLATNFPDDELERAAATDRRQAVSTAYCTQWWMCPF
jgi:hypothetical protein